MSCGSASPPYPGMFEKVGLDLSEELEQAHTYMGIVDDFPDDLVGKNQFAPHGDSQRPGIQFSEV